MNINTVIGMERHTVIIMHSICYGGNVEKTVKNDGEYYHAMKFILVA